MTLTCFERALSLADDQTLPDVWFNIGHVALVSVIVIRVCVCVCVCVCVFYFSSKVFSFVGFGDALWLSKEL
jgi:hypothetical protein